MPRPEAGAPLTITPALLRDWFPAPRRTRPTAAACSSSAARPLDESAQALDESAQVLTQQQV